MKAKVPESVDSEETIEEKVIRFRLKGRLLFTGSAWKGWTWGPKGHLFYQTDWIWILEDIGKINKETYSILSNML